MILTIIILISLLLLQALFDVRSFSCSYTVGSRRKGDHCRHRYHLYSSKERTTSSIVHIEDSDYGSDNNQFQYPWPTEQTTKIQSHYIYHPKIPVIDTDWQQLCLKSSTKDTKEGFFFPFPLNHNNSRSNHRQQTKSLDLTRIWTLEDNPHNVAKEIIHESLQYVRHYSSQLNVLDTTDEETMIVSLADSLRSYRDFCQVHLLNRLQQKQQESVEVTESECFCCEDNIQQKVKFKCRLVATMGPSGAKCPQYHIDHVPARWIQTFVGPGVELVAGTNGINWNAFDSKDDDDDADETINWNVNDRNNLIVDTNEATVYCAKQGEAVLMLGNEWNEMMASTTSSTIIPVVHKSPEVSKEQPRVLLTQDILIG